MKPASLFCIVIGMFLSLTMLILACALQLDSADGSGKTNNWYPIFTESDQDCDSDNKIDSVCEYREEVFTNVTSVLKSSEENGINYFYEIAKHDNIHSSATLNTISNFKCFFFIFIFCTI